MRGGDVALVDARLTRYHGPGPRHPGLYATRDEVDNWAARTRDWALVQEGELERLDRADALESGPLEPWAEPLATWSDERRDEYLARLSRAEGISLEEAQRRWTEVVGG